MTHAPSGARPIWAEINRAALACNLATIRSLRGAGAKCIVPVKANAYGHDAVTIAGWLNELEVDGIATANIDDAVAIRSSGCRIRILMYDCQLPEGTSELLSAELTPTVCTMEAAEAVSTAARSLTAVHIKVDAGLGRLGVSLENAEEFALRVHALPNVYIEGIYTHLPFWDTQSRLWAQRQLKRFASLVHTLTNKIGRIHFVQAASSAAILTGLSDPFDTVAPGHAIYGFSPLETGEASHGLRSVANVDSGHADDGSAPLANGEASHGLRPVLHALRSRLVHVASQPRGTASPLFGHYASAMAVRTGVVILGLDNGWRRPVEGTVGCALFRGKRVRLLGVTAEFSIVDLSEFPDAAVGEVITFIGADGEERIDIAEVAKYLGVPPVVVAVNLRRVRYLPVG